MVSMSFKNRPFLSIFHTFSSREFRNFFSSWHIFAAKTAMVFCFINSSKNPMFFLWNNSGLFLEKVKQNKSNNKNQDLDTSNIIKSYRSHDYPSLVGLNDLVNGRPSPEGSSMVGLLGQCRDRWRPSGWRATWCHGSSVLHGFCHIQWLNMVRYMVMSCYIDIYI